MRIVVSGAGGMIGSALLDALQADGHDVLRLVRRAPSGPHEAGWDPSSGDLAPDVLRGVDGVVNLNGVGIGDARWTEERKRRIRDSRVASTRLLAETAAGLDEPPAVLVSQSGINHYGDRGDDVLTEDEPPGDDFMASVTRDWEAATGAAASAGVRTVLLRTGVVLDRSDGLLAKVLLPFRLGLGGRLGSGEQWMSWISLPDHVSVVRRALGDERLAGPVNAVAPQPVRNRDWTRTLGEVLGRPTVLPTPLLPLKLRYGAELVESLMLASVRAVPARLEAMGHDFAHPTVDAALRATLGR